MQLFFDLLHKLVGVFLPKVVVDVFLQVDNFKKVILLLQIKFPQGNIDYGKFISSALDFI